MRKLVYAFLKWQQSLSDALDRCLPADCQIDGNRDFADTLVRPYLRPEAVVYDFGGGKNPLIGLETKRALGLRVIGVDIDAAELAAAPPGGYDEEVCADITQYRGRGDADLVICQALLEHVPDAGAAIRAIASTLRPGGKALLFLPCRNAIFARLNLLFPQPLKKRLLFAIFPHTERDQGFRAYYDRCTPGNFRRLAAANGLAVELCRPYYRSRYFSFFFPLYLVWRAWVLLFRAWAGAEAAETFSMVVEKPAEVESSVEF